MCDVDVCLGGVPCARVRAHRRAPLGAEYATPPPSPPPSNPIASREQEVYQALLLGLHDYVEKNGFGSVVLGLSGGIDSALVACLAVDALGPQRVNVAIMPSPYSSTATQQDAHALAQALGMQRARATDPSGRWTPTPRPWRRISPAPSQT